MALSAVAVAIVDAIVDAATGLIAGAIAGGRARDQVLNSGMSGFDPHMQKDEGTAGKLRGR